MASFATVISTFVAPVITASSCKHFSIEGFLHSLLLLLPLLLLLQKLLLVLPLLQCDIPIRLPSASNWLRIPVFEIRIDTLPGTSHRLIVEKKSKFGRPRRTVQ